MQAAKTRRALCPVVELELIPYLRIENWAWQLRIANSKLRLSWCHTKLGSTLSLSSPHRFRWKQIVEIFDASGKVKIDKQINFVAFWVNWLQSSVVPLWDAFPWNQKETKASWILGQSEPKREITWQGQSGEQGAFARVHESWNPSGPLPHFQPSEERYCFITDKGNSERGI